MNALGASETDRTGRKSHAERTELSDSLMLDACVDLIVEQGTENTTLKAVGERAGYSRGLAGARFRSKPGMFCFVIRRVAEYWRGEMQKLTDGRIGYEAICAAIDAHHRFCRRTPRPFKAFYLLWFESIGLEGELHDVVLAIHRRRLRDVSSWIQQGIEAGELSAQIDAEAVARHFLTSMFGIVYLWLIDPGRKTEIEQLHDQLKQTMRFLLPAPAAGRKT